MTITSWMLALLEGKSSHFNYVDKECKLVNELRNFSAAIC